jgi:hypothetical protein
MILSQEKAVSGRCEMQKSDTFSVPALMLADPIQNIICIFFPGWLA